MTISIEDTGWPSMSQMVELHLDRWQLARCDSLLSSRISLKEPGEMDLFSCQAHSQSHSLTGARFSETQFKTQPWIRNTTPGHCYWTGINQFNGRDDALPLTKVKLGRARHTFRWTRSVRSHSTDWIACTWFRAAHEQQVTQYHKLARSSWSMIWNCVYQSLCRSLRLNDFPASEDKRKVKQSKTYVTWLTSEPFIHHRVDRPAPTRDWSLD